MGDTAGSREGSQFGPYLLRRLVGRGGMGDVYEAEDTVRERVVALKLMSQTLSSDPVFRTRMQREARTAGRLQEPHVVPIHDFGEIDGQLYVDMRLIDGRDVATILSRYGPLTPPRAVAILRQIGSALDAAHAAGVMHRDVKPENILVSGDDFAYLVDFGIASATSDEKLTQFGTTVGTFKYMAPERFSDSDVTYRADIYALACVLYECLTGSPPYQGDQISVMSTHLHQAIPRPSAARPGIPAAFDQVIARGMAKDPLDRYPTCGDLSAAAYAALATPDQDRATDILQRSQAAELPAAFAGQAPTGFPPAPPAMASQTPPQGPGWPASATGTPFPPSGPIPAQTGWPGAPGWGTGDAGSVVAPSWGQPAPRASRNAWLWVSLAAFVVVAVVGAVLVVAQPWRSSGPGGSKPPAASDAVELRVLDDGVLVGSSAAPVTIDIFNEPICPPCGSFIRSNAGDIETAVNNKKLAVRYHLLNFLDDKSHSQNYSTRAVAATYCVAAQNDPKLYMSFYSGIFASAFQPQEGAAEDRTDGELAQLAKTGGVDADAINCIKSGGDMATAKAKAESGDTTLAGFNASGTPFVWDGTKSLNYQDATWLTKLLG
ncbi:serine/threonine protein kinase PknE [Mycobacterium montefiorense]|uniref:non-specific serine/threonine protein kinase n=1 Tax=Mycobacterium montefiorense TaxID=154654 RepID=A0AA37UNC2_9MYCO|nr:serine/threonine protein kinase PknE [Mycobacterium montefiorense]GBG38724.1 serine/threonine-protein kinase PknE [Mycobacterium montefiorense]GKU43599.1 serine/threonine-protein kinase PknE [Mycobacterium montefiorense]GKU49939.1 serine/threonine-protein kinase PknE [Mycobacterium montefiorense]GKU57736.1 serine/threonine-protein kinase PknE [Mycobacterium montefiorense]GKU68756.1 serine/threonine-protein kinase PknE [Mycobacterium montefiorense]